ncbi:glycoside hydrolase family 26 protein [uncultured Jatrophihabitans sp.]|uniref:glycoside hydrolase family 26 protein n=1 Tax=uncultured Jatrophihabitans sp. TaxID=1610747 RepID=UPI0035CC9C52
MQRGVAPDRPDHPDHRGMPTLGVLLLVAALVAGVVAAVVPAPLATSTRPGAAAVTAMTVHLGSTPEVPDASPVAATVAYPRRTWGVTLPDLPGDTSGLTALERSTGQRPGVVMWYVAWSLRAGFPTSDAERIRRAGAIPEITWEPWDPAAGTSQPDYALARIARGDYDAYLNAWARAIAAWGHPLRLRLAQEMNGTWYPWADGQNGNAPGSFVRAWNHVVSVFRANHATRVTWVWSPNVPFPGSAPLSRVFPGDANVGEVALDGYNWSTLQPGSEWTSFATVFGPGMAQLARLSRRPVSIGEVGCPETGGNKAAWTAAMWRTLRTWRQVRGVMFFSFDKEADWRVDSTPAAGAAFARGVGAYLRH